MNPNRKALLRQIRDVPIEHARVSLMQCHPKMLRALLRSGHVVHENQTLALTDKGRRAVKQTCFGCVCFFGGTCLEKMQPLTRHDSPHWCPGKVRPLV